MVRLARGLAMSEVPLKPGWVQITLGDVVENINDYHDRTSTRVERYVSGEHIDEGSLAVRRWGETTDALFPPTFNRRFQSGDVLFHSRNLRKLARPDFDGVTGEKLFVLRVRRPELLLPALLPFLLQTARFTEYVNRMWAGSTNKFLNKTPLMRYQLSLPPMAEQQTIADTLGKVANLADRYAEAACALSLLTKRFLLTEYETACQRFPMQGIGELGELRMGRQKAPRFSRGVNPRQFLRVANVGDLELRLGEVERMDFSDEELTRYRLEPGDILLTEGDLMSEFNVGRPALFRGEIDDCCFQNTLIRFRPDSHLRPEYSLLLLEAARLSRVFAQAAKTTTVTHLGLGRLTEVRIPVPAIERQDTVARVFVAMLDARVALRGRASECAALRSRLLADTLA